MSADKTNSLTIAIREGNLERVNDLIDTLGLSNSIAWSDGYAFLREAIDNDHTEIAKLILMNINTEIDSERLALTSKGRNALSSIVNIVQFTILELTVINGDLEILQMLLDKAEGNRDLYVKPLLHVAVRNNKMAFVELLLKSGAEVNFKSEGLTPLHIAISEDCLQVAEYLLINGAHVDSVCFIGRTRCTPLELAITRGHASFVKLLLEHGASIDSRNNTLQFAFFKGHSIIAAYIYICSLDLKPYNRSKLLNAVVQSENEYRTIFQGLLKTCKFGEFVGRKTMLPFLVHAAVKAGCIKVVQYFVTFGFEVNALTFHSPQKRERQTLLHSAVKDRQTDMAEYLIQIGSDINAIDTEQKPPICYAIESGNVKMTKLLICYGARIKNRPQFFRIAAKSANREIVELLLEHDPHIDINAKDRFGSTVLHNVSIGCLNENSDNKARAEIVQILLNRGADVNSRGYRDLRPLHLAVQAGRIEVVETLLAHNADVNVTAAEEFDTTPLHECIRCTSGDICVAIVKLLLASNADVNAKTKSGTTALHHASEKGNSKVVEILLLHDADIDARSLEGATPFHWASIRGDVKTVEILLKFGSDINATCHSGKTSFDYIVSSRRRDCKQLVNILKQQIIKRRVANLYVCKENLELFGRAKYKLNSFKESCKREIVKMRKTKITGNASFYDILSKDVHDIAIYAKYEVVVETLESEEWRGNFPIYCDIISNHFKKAQTREVLLNPSVNSFNFLIGHEFLDVLTIEIFRYLSDEDLGNLIKACQNSRSSERTNYVVRTTIEKLKNFFAEAKNFSLRPSISFNYPHL